jgi:hypothetical protein
MRIKLLIGALILLTGTATVLGFKNYELKREVRASNEAAIVVKQEIERLKSIINYLALQNGTSQPKTSEDLEVVSYPGDSSSIGTISIEPDIQISQPFEGTVDSEFDGDSVEIIPMLSEPMPEFRAN